MNFTHTHTNTHGQSLYSVWLIDFGDLGRIRNVVVSGVNRARQKKQKHTHHKVDHYLSNAQSETIFYHESNHNQQKSLHLLCIFTREKINA